jgi:oxygen-independent coproporphyrinogen-3 oxidase
LRAAGVTRLSLGAQSFSSDELRFLDRIHSPEATDAAVRLARTAGFASVGLDLIYGLPGQTEKSWLATLNHACGLNPDHVSAYALTVEDATPLARKVRRGEVTLPEDDEIADLYEAASDFLGAEGFEHYELSNWARPGHQSRHNLTYWADGDYLGIGAGAHGYLQGERYENIADPREYIAALSAGSETPLPAAINRYRCDNQTSMSDWLGLRLRLIDGFASTEFADRFGMGLPEAVGPVVEECVAAGVLETDPRVRLTRKGRLLHGEVSARLLSYLSRSGAALAGAR